ncbi:unnamed protein product [Rangifer tarandus platyrhynchus]|uniref:Uncharacterized protein n=1 Tax=Rangifer tarandus platyrhynchus TaxID=3082113 RepID=A0AC59Y4E3_RANTA
MAVSSRPQKAEAPPDTSSAVTRVGFPNAQLRLGHESSRRSHECGTAPIWLGRAHEAAKAQGAATLPVTSLLIPEPGGLERVLGPAARALHLCPVCQGLGGEASPSRHSPSSPSFLEGAFLVSAGCKGKSLFLRLVPGTA